MFDYTELVIKLLRMFIRFRPKFSNLKASSLYLETLQVDEMQALCRELELNTR